MKQIGTKELSSNDVMSLHRDMTAVETLNETQNKFDINPTVNNGDIPI